MELSYFAIIIGAIFVNNVIRKAMWKKEAGYRSATKSVNARKLQINDPDWGTGKEIP